MPTSGSPQAGWSFNVPSHGLGGAVSTPRRSPTRPVSAKLLVPPRCVNIDTHTPTTLRPARTTPRVLTPPLLAIPVGSATCPPTTSYRRPVPLPSRPVHLQ